MPVLLYILFAKAPVLHHALMTGLYTLISPTFYIETQAAFDAFIPTYLVILTVASLVLIPLAIITAKKFYYENAANVQKKPQEKETLGFRISYWLLILVIVGTFVRAL